MDAQDIQDKNSNYQILFILYIHVDPFPSFLLRDFVPSCDNFRIPFRALCAFLRPIPL